VKRSTSDTAGGVGPERGGDPLRLVAGEGHGSRERYPQRLDHELLRRRAWLRLVLLLRADDAYREDEQHGARDLVLFSDWPNPVLSEVEDDPVGLPRERGRLGLAGGGGSTALGDKALERHGETVERLLEELDLLRRDVGGRLGAFGDSLDGRQVQSSLTTRRRAASSGGTAPSPAAFVGVETKVTLGEIQECHVAEGQPWEHDDVESFLGFLHGQSLDSLA